MKRKIIFNFFIVFLILTGLNAGFNLYINPFGYYGDNHVGSPPIFNARYEKYRSILEMNEKPQCIVMGSSNSMRMLPKTIEKTSGLNSFNYGVFHARAEDFYCIGELLTSKPETTPKAVFLCIDDWNFAHEPPLPDEVFEGAEKRLAYKQILSQHLDDYSRFSLLWARIKSSISWSQTKTSINTLKKGFKENNTTRNRPKLSDVFYKNGVRKNYKSIFEVDITELAERGGYDVGADIKIKHKDLFNYSNHPLGFLSDSHEMFEKFSTRRWNYFKRFIANLYNHNVKVIINVMPNQPFYQELVRKSTNYERRIEVLLNLLHQLQEEYPCIIIIKDNHTIEKFNGSERHFFDHMHPTSYNSNLMIKSTLKQLPENAL